MADAINRASDAAERAIKAEKEDLGEVTDSTIGSILDDEGKLLTIPQVVEVFHTSDLYFGYPPIDGFKLYRERTTSWILGSNLKTAKENHTLLTFSTMGGTGAISMAFRFAQTYGFEVLFPELGRPCYTDIANGASAYYRKYQLFDRDFKFNIKAVSDMVQEDKNRFKGFLLVINDPCQNPSGHTMSKEECQELFDTVSKINRTGGTRIAILWDVAYMSYAKESPAWLPMVCQADGAFTSLIAFSASKSFALYGLRLGMILGILPKGDEKTKDILFNIFARTAKQSYIVTDGLGMSALENVMSPEVAKSVKPQLTSMGNLLRDRGERMKAALDEQDISYLPYQEGFYLTAVVESNPEILSQFLEKRKVFLYPMQPRYLRISIAALKPGQEKTIARAIKLAENKAQDPEQVKRLKQER